MERERERNESASVTYALNMKLLLVLVTSISKRETTNKLFYFEDCYDHVKDMQYFFNSKTYKTRKKRKNIENLYTFVVE
jgi:hypothetical protein